MELRILLAEVKSLMAELDKFRPLSAEIEARILQEPKRICNLSKNKLKLIRENKLINLRYSLSFYIFA